MVELLLVMSVIVILVAVAGPALRGLLGTDNRKAAVNQLIGALDQARASALEKGVPVHVGFAGPNFPESSGRFSRYIVFRDRSADLGDPATGPARVMLSKWQSLPAGVVLADFGALPKGITETTQQADGFPPLTTGIGGASSAGSFPLHVLTFNPAGSVASPPGAGLLDGGATTGFLITQGYYPVSGGLQETRRRPSGSPIQYDRVSLARHTGRARFDPATVSR